MMSEKTVVYEMVTVSYLLSTMLGLTIMGIIYGEHG
jgi:hypothetical protein